MSGLLMYFVVVIASADATIRDPSSPLLSAKKIVEKKVSGAPKKTPISQAAYVLSSIFISKSKKIAVINSKQYSEGDLIGSYRIKQIGLNRVTIASSLRTKVLELYPVNKTGFIIK